MSEYQTLWGSVAFGPREAHARHGVERDASSSHEALLFVVNDVANPGYHTSIVARLAGGAVINTSYFLSNSRQGVSIAFKAAFGTKKTLCVTDGFQARYPPLLETIDTCIGLPDSRWSRIDAAAAVDYHDRDDARPKAQRRPMDCLVLCLVAEKEAAPLKEKRWAMTLPTILDFVGKIAASTKNVGDM